MGLFISIVFSIVLLTFTSFVTKYFRCRSLLNNIPGPLGTLLVGNALEIAKRGPPSTNVIPYLSQLTELYGPRTKFMLGWSPMVLLSDVNDLVKILKSSVHLHKGDLYEFFSDWLGSSLPFAPVEEWQRKRKSIHPSFKFASLLQYIPIMSKHSESMVKNLKKILNEDGGRDGQAEIKILPHISLCTLEILLESAMGLTFPDSNKAELHDYSRNIHDLLLLIVKRSYSIWLRPSFVWSQTSYGKRWKAGVRYLHEVTQKIISERCNATKQFQHETTQQHEIFLDRFLKLQQQKVFTEKDIREETGVLVVGGYDSSTSTLAWALLRLGHHQDIQQKVYDEMTEIFGGDKTRPITKDDVRRMKYTEMVLNESMRLHTPIPVIMRQIKEECQLDSKVTLMPGITAWVFIHGVHHNPEYYPNPSKFDPERFSVEQTLNRHPYAFIPFSAGPRDCIGRQFAMIEQKILIAQLIRNFKIACVDSPETAVPVWHSVVQPKNGVTLKFQNRD